MTRKQTKKKRDALLEKAKVAKALEKKEVENFDHLLDPLEKYLLAEKEKEQK